MTDIERAGGTLFSCTRFPLDLRLPIFML